MTTLNRADIPASISTIEQLHLWTGLLLAYINQGATAQEGYSAADASTVRVISAAPYLSTAVSGDPHWRYICRSSIRLNTAWQLQTNKLWMNAVEISTAVVPTEFKV